MLERGAITTPVDKRAIIIPRPSPFEQDTAVVLQRGNARLDPPIAWSESEAYMLEPGVLFRPTWGQPRVWVLRFRCKGESEADDGDNGDGMEEDLEILELPSDL